MKINKLFNFIRNELGMGLSDVASLQVTNFTLKANQDGVDCAFYSLPISAQRSIIFSNNNSYDLDAHHLSFYATQKDNDPYLSQYHYTGYFIDGNGARNQLHVYFDNNDQSVHASFSVNDAEQELNKDDLNKVTRFALTNSSRVMAVIRKQHDDAIAMLENDYDEIEKKLCALSEDLLSQHVAYQAQVNAIVFVLKTLTNYHYDDRYKHILSLFEKIASLDFDTSAVNTGLTAALPDDEKYETSTNQPVAKVITRKNKLQPKIQEAFAVSKRLAKERVLTDKISLLVDLHEKINCLLVLAEDDTFQVSALDLQQINSLYVANNQQIEKILLNALMFKNMDLASPFQGVIKFFPHNWLLLALKTSNPVMLDFILTNGNFCLNTTVVIDNFTAVQYCYKQGVKAIDCFSVLIKHKASLLCAAEDGLPIAYHVTADKFHPLRQALASNMDLTFASRKFYKSLIYQLEIYQLELDINDPAKTKILNAVANYKIELTNIANFGNNKAAFRQSLQERDIALGFTVSKQVPEILNHPDYQKAIKAFQQQMAKMKKSMTARSFYRLNFAAFDLQKNVNVMMKKQEANNPTGNCELTREYLIEVLNEQRTALIDIKALNDIQFKLKNAGPIYSKQRLAEVKDLEKQGQTLQTEIGKTAEKYQFLQNTNQDAGDIIALSDTLTNIQGSVTSMIDALSMVKKGIKAVNENDSQSMRKLLGFFANPGSGTDSDDEENKLEKKDVTDPALRL